RIAGDAARGRAGKDAGGRPERAGWRPGVQRARDVPAGKRRRGEGSRAPVAAAGDRMKLTGFRGYNWEADGYWVAIPDGAMMVNNIEAQVLNRPGTYPTFGVGLINPMYLSCQVGYNGVLSLEAAFMNFFKRL